VSGVNGCHFTSFQKGVIGKDRYWAVGMPTRRTKHPILPVWVMSTNMRSSNVWMSSSVSAPPRDLLSWKDAIGGGGGPDCSGRTSYASFSKDDMVETAMRCDGYADEAGLSDNRLKSRDQCGEIAWHGIGLFAKESQLDSDGKSTDTVTSQGSLEISRLNKSGTKTGPPATIPHNLYFGPHTSSHAAK